MTVILHFKNDNSNLRVLKRKGKSMAREEIYFQLTQTE